MHLSRFILDNMEPILADWEEFAASLLPAAAEMTPLALRNHANRILEAVAADLTTPQTGDEQAAKSRGQAPVAADAPETAAQTHAVLRARAGFDINQLVAEYRALRASVLRLWIEQNANENENDNENLDAGQLIRFNEAIDQAIAESIGYFHMQTTRARNLLLGMLGHDMRTPLGAILNTGEFLTRLHAGDEVTTAGQRLIRSGQAMQSLLDDLVDFSRTQLGTGIRVHPQDVDLAVCFGDEVEQLRSAHPQGQIELEISGDTHGRWDGKRLQQVLRNLVENAIAHGTGDAPVRVGLAGEDSEIRLEVTNSGPAIDPSARELIFEPLHRRTPADVAAQSSDGLGLGLFVVREIAKAHGGRVEVLSEGNATSFIVHLPR